jgi:hypothetical protein
LCREIADQDRDGCLAKEEFVICMYFVNARKEKGIAIPSSLPPELEIPKTRKPDMD